MRARVAVLIALVWVLATVQGLPLAAAQTADKYKVEVTQVEAGQFPLITLYVNVTDEAGKPVTNLTKDDFSIVEEGKQVAITDFAGLGSDRPVDVVFVFDTTGSMGNEVDGVKERCIAFAEELENKGRDYRLGLVTFWDEVKGVYGTGGKLTDDVDEFRGWISVIRPVGGEGAGDEENDFGALKEAATRMQFRAEAQRVFILITDNLPHHYGDAPDDGVPFDDPDLTVDRTIEILSDPPVTVYAIAYNDAEFRQIADETGGRFYDIAAETDFTDIIDEIGGLIATQYRLTYNSARPSYDGTRRGITVQVGAGGGGGSGAGTGAYVEEHMVNFQSNLLVGLAFLVPLLAALAVPALVGRTRGRQMQPAQAAQPQGAYSLPPQTVAPFYPQAVTPPRTQQSRTDAVRPLSPQAGTADRTLASYPTVAATAAGATNCPRCGKPVRPGVRFCGNCGYSMGSPQPQPGAPATGAPTIRPADAPGLAPTVRSADAPGLAALVCPTCGNVLKPGAHFCGRCGTRL